MHTFCSFFWCSLSGERQRTVYSYGNESILLSSPKQFWILILIKVSSWSIQKDASNNGKDTLTTSIITLLPVTNEQKPMSFCNQHQQLNKDANFHPDPCMYFSQQFLYNLQNWSFIASCLLWFLSNIILLSSKRFQQNRCRTWFMLFWYFFACPAQKYVLSIKIGHRYPIYCYTLFIDSSIKAKSLTPSNAWI